MEATCNQNEDLVKSCLEELIQNGSVKREKGRYSLTESGQKKAIKELQRYSLRPAMYVLLEMWYAEKFGIQME